VSLASKWKELQSRLVSQEQSYAKETLTIQDAETNLKIMELEGKKTSNFRVQPLLLRST